MLCDEVAAGRADADADADAEAAGAERKTRTPHSDVGKYYKKCRQNTTQCQDAGASAGETGEAASPLWTPASPIGMP